MCMGGGKAPSPRPMLPEAPTPPTMSLDEKQRSDQRRKRALGSTLLTSGQGLNTTANTDQKTLLGS